MAGVSSRGRKQGCFQPGRSAGPGRLYGLCDNAVGTAVQQNHGSEVHRLGNRTGEIAPVKMG